MPQLPLPIPDAELVETARNVMRAAKFPFLATEEAGQPRVRPISPVRVDGFTVYFANLRSYGKTRELAANPRVELCYLADNHDQVRLTGRVEIVTDRHVLEEIWQENALLRRYLGSIDNPELIVYRMLPTRVRFMREWALQYQEVPVD